jgi:hypothetical protein
MASVRWRLLGVNDIPLGHQPGEGSPLELQYNKSGRTHLPGYSGEGIVVCECYTDALTVSVSITPDNPKIDALGEAESAPVEPTPGRFMWQDYADNRVVLTVAVPETPGVEWSWNFGNEPPIALRIKIKVKR